MSQAFDDDGELMLSVERVSKEYPPLGPTRVRRLFARLGGLQLEELLPEAVEDDEDDDEDEDEDEDRESEEQLPEREVAGRCVVDGVTLQARAGERLALVGPTGAGKTVLLKLIGGLVPPTSGRIVVRGLVAPALGVLSRSMPRGSVQSALPRLAAIAGVSPALVRARLDEIGDLIDLSSLRDVQTGALDSRRKGQVILATMLVLDPDVLVVDIPIERDAFGERCLERFDRLRERGSVVITESRALGATPLVPDRAVELDRGRVVGDEPYVAPAPRVPKLPKPPRPPKEAREPKERA